MKKIKAITLLLIGLVIGVTLGNKTTTLNESKKYLSSEELTNVELTQKLEELKTKVTQLETINGNTSIDGTITSSINSLNGALAGGKISFGIDEEGNYGYIKEGENTVNPFAVIGAGEYVNTYFTTSANNAANTVKATNLETGKYTVVTFYLVGYNNGSGFAYNARHNLSGTKYSSSSGFEIENTLSDTKVYVYDVNVTSSTVSFTYPATTTASFDTTSVVNMAFMILFKR